MSVSSSRWTASTSKALAISIIAAAVTWACGGGGDDNSSTTPPPTGGASSPSGGSSSPDGGSSSPSGGSSSPDGGSSSPSGGGQAVPTLAMPAIDIDQLTPQTSTQGATTFPSFDTATGGQGQPMGNYVCAAMDHTYHVHAHLTLIVDGVQRAIPDNIGAVSQPAGFCHYQVHTHDSTGKIHVESPTPIQATLGDFFMIWGMPLSATNVAGFTQGPINIYVADADGTVTQYTGDPTKIELTSHRQITIVMGSGQPISQLPNYTWSGN